MKETLIFLDVATEELKDAVKWYEEKTAGLGEILNIEVSKKIESILRYPNRYPIRKGYNREALIKRFPYFIIYRYNKLKHQITITSIFHTSRNPKNKYRK